MKKITFITLCTLACLIAAKLPASAAEVKNQLPPPVPSAAAVAQVPAVQPLPVTAAPAESAYNYNPAGKPDPFLPFVEEEVAAKKKLEVKKDVISIFPLQRDDLDKFRLVGIAGDNTRRIAMVEDAAKKNYPIIIGTHIGIHNGKVKEILTDRIIIEEYETKKAKRVILKLHKNQNEVKP